jgi:hypothetical protein
MSQLLWDPARDGERILDEFIGLHYGRAALLFINARPVRWPTPVLQA